MFFPGVGRAFHVPHAIVPALLAFFAVLVGVTAWAIASRSNAGIETPAHPFPDIASVRSVAYTLPGRDFDDVVVRPSDDRSAPRVIATFPNSGSTGYHIHGASSPLGESIAVVSLAPFTGRSGASLSLVTVDGGATRRIEGSFDYFTRIAWAPDGSRLAAVRYWERDGARMSSIVEVEPATGQARTVAEFQDAIDVVPVGYSFDSERLYIVVVDNRGSNLFFERGGRVQLEAELSPGRTRDWALSPDGSRLAFVDILAGGSRTFVGRTLVIATRSVTTQPATADEFGASWMPGSPVPAFGGPGGSWQLTEPESPDAYLIPAAWSPDSTYLVGSVFAPAGTEAITRSLELLERETTTTPGRRVVLSDEPGAAFLGWVHDLD